VSVEVCDAPKKFVFVLSYKENHLCDWVFEIEPTSSGCRVTHAWVAGKQWEQFAPFGKDISGVEDRATHNLRNMGVTLDNLVKALATV
jgi:hypothetical protein